MANKQIKDFTDIGSPDRGDYLLISDTSATDVTKKVSIGSILDSAYEQSNQLEELTDVGSPLSPITDDVFYYNGSQWSNNANVIGSITEHTGSLTDLAGSLLAENVWDLSGSTLTSETGSYNLDLETGSLIVNGSNIESELTLHTGSIATNVLNISLNSGSILTNASDIADLAGSITEEDNWDLSGSTLSTSTGSYNIDLQTGSLVIGSVTADYITVNGSDIEAELILNTGSISLNTVHREDITGSDHSTLITEIGLNTGSISTNTSNITEHTGSLIIHRELDDAETTLTNLWSGSKIQDELTDLSGSIIAEDIWNISGSTVTSKTGSYNVDLELGSVLSGSFIGDGSGLTGVSSVGSLNDLGDVTITSAGSLETLIYDGSAWINTNEITFNQINAGSDGHTNIGSPTATFAGIYMTDSITGSLYHLEIQDGNLIGSMVE